MVTAEMASNARTLMNAPTSNPVTVTPRAQTYLAHSNANVHPGSQGMEVRAMTSTSALVIPTRAMPTQRAQTSPVASSVHVGTASAAMDKHART